MSLSGIIVFKYQGNLIGKVSYGRFAGSNPAPDSKYKVKHMSDNPFIKKVGKNEYRCLFGVSADEANSIFSGRSSSMNEIREAQIQINRILSDLEKKTGRVVTGISVYEDRGMGIPSQRFVEIEMSSKPGQDYLI